MSSIFSKKCDTVNTANYVAKGDTNNNAKINNLSDYDELDQKQKNQRYDQRCEMTLSLNDIIKAIPENATKHPLEHLQKDHTEWRWRFFDLKGRKLIEISKKSPNCDRIYVDNTGGWTQCELKGNWDKYLTDTRYCYGA